MNVIELKAKAYDTLAEIEFLQARLRELNAQIAKLSQEKPADKSEE